MLSQTGTIALAILLFPSFIAALPQVSDVTRREPTVLYRWSSDPACNSEACVVDCAAAAVAVCDKVALEPGSPALEVTVNHCTAHYMWEIGNDVPTKESCYAAYTYINDEGAKGAGPNNCGGTVGGALGFDAQGKRTKDPVYILSPTGGIGNCFKAPGDNTPPKPRDELSNGKKLSTDSCPATTSRRQRDALQRLEGRQAGIGTAGPGSCVVGAVGALAGCTALCVETVWTASWWTGAWIPAAASLACFGGCYILDVPLALRCIDDATKRVEPRATAQHQIAACSNGNNWAFECPAMRQGLLSAFSCDETQAEDGESVDVNTGGSGMITT
ncbi:MAG: hypothetical protein Q9226_008889 [Calogaya cf. arnoldii]